MSEKLSTRSLELLTLERVAHLATADQYARPHVVPIVFVYEPPFVFTPIDAKPKSVEDWHDLRRIKNVETNGRAKMLAVGRVESVITQTMVSAGKSDHARFVGRQQG